jgi:hypothetical protein
MNKKIIADLKGLCECRAIRCGRGGFCSFPPHQNTIGCMGAYNLHLGEGKRVPVPKGLSISVKYVM